MKFVLSASIIALSLALVPVAMAGDGAQAAPAAADNGPCDSGYTWFTKIGKCRERHDPVLVEKVACRPGDLKKVPDPNRPGGFRILVCNFVKSGG